MFQGYQDLLLSPLLIFWLLLLESSRWWLIYQLRENAGWSCWPCPCCCEHSGNESVFSSPSLYFALSFPLSFALFFAINRIKFKSENNNQPMVIHMLIESEGQESRHNLIRSIVKLQWSVCQEPRVCSHLETWPGWIDFPVCTAQLLLQKSRWRASACWGILHQSCPLFLAIFPSILGI